MLARRIYVKAAGIGDGNNAVITVISLILSGTSALVVLSNIAALLRLGITPRLPAIVIKVSSTGFHDDPSGFRGRLACSACCSQPFSFQQV